MQARQQPWNALHAMKKNLMNKTWLAMEVQYFRFIGQIPHDCPEYNTCNTSKSVGWGAYKSMVNLISSKNQRQDHAFGVRDCSSHLQKGQRAARAWATKQVGCCNAKMVALLGAHWALCQTGRRHGNNSAWYNLFNFGPVSVTLRQSTKSSSSIGNGAWGDDLLIPFSARLWWRALLRA